VRHLYEKALERRGGFTITTAESLQNPDYRGPEFVRLGASLAGDGPLTPRLIGDASRAGRHDQQALKRVWHYVARFGSPEMAPQKSGLGPNLYVVNGHLAKNSIWNRATKALRRR
jgi:hypothetical protein